MSHSSCRVAVALALLAPALAAQEFEPLLRQLGPLGPEQITEFRHALVDDDGDWNALVRVFEPTQILDTALVRNGTALLFAGDHIPSPPARITVLWDIAGSTHNLAVAAILGRIHTPVTTRGIALFRDGRPVLLTDQPVAAGRIPNGALLTGLQAIGANERSTVLALVQIDVGSPLEALIRFDFDAFGLAHSRMAEIVTGQTLPDGSVVADFGLHSFGVPVNERGDWLCIVSTTDGGERLVADGRIVLATGTPAPVAGRNIADILDGCDLNDRGEYAAAVRLDGDPATDLLLIEDGNALAQEGEVLPALAPYALIGARFATMRCSNSGPVYWQALTDGPLGHNGAYMREREAIVQAGVTRIAGSLVTGIDANDGSFEASPSGRFFLGRVYLAGVNGLVLVKGDFGAAVPLPGCAGNPGELRLASGRVLAGQTITLALDGPAPIGSQARVAFALGAARLGDCGIVTPLGEVLIDWRRVASINAGAYTGAPLALPLSLPPDPALVDLELFAQGAFAGPGLVLTNALHLEIGAP